MRTIEANDFPGCRGEPEEVQRMSKSKKEAEYAGAEMAAAIEYLGRKTRALRPRGDVRNGGWWPHEAESRPCCAKTPWPDGYNEWVKLKHCCTGKHLAVLYKCDEKILRAVARKLTTNGSVVRREHLPLVWALKKLQGRLSAECLGMVMAVWHDGCKLDDILIQGPEVLALGAGLAKSGLEPADAWRSALVLSETA